MQVPRSLLGRDDVSDDMLEGFVNYARMIDGVEVSALVSETSDGSIRASLRSWGRVAVDRVAKQFGGGGHPAAAGCSFRDGGLTEAYAALRTALVGAVQDRG